MTLDTILEFYRSGGPIMHAILTAGLLGFAILLERVYVLFIRGAKNSRQFTDQVVNAVAAGKIAEAKRLCAGSDEALPRIGAMVLASPSRAEADLQNLADAAAISAMPQLTRRLQYLPMLANVATLLGLLGTIFGLREAFASVAAAAAAERSARLAAGIALALNATGFGLFFAIPLSVAHAYLAGRAEAMIERVDEFSVRLINAFSVRGPTA
jgi:biopolymer transport protein ExbB/TolQ